MAKLVHLNGPTGVGKSTIAHGLVARRALALNLDVDELRVRLGQWDEQPQSKRIARDLAFELAARHLARGRDVVMPQLIVRTDVIEQLAQIAETANSDFEEVILLGRRDDIVERIRRERGVGMSHPRHQLSVEELAAQIDYALSALVEIASERPAPRVVDVGGIEPPAAIAYVAAAIGWADER